MTHAIPPGPPPLPSLTQAAELAPATEGPEDVLDRWLGTAEATQEPGAPLDGIRPQALSPKAAAPAESWGHHSTSDSVRRLWPRLDPFGAADGTVVLSPPGTAPSLSIVDLAGRTEATFPLNDGSPALTAAEAAFLNASPDSPLNGLRIFLDPGHYGGELAELNGKFVEAEDGTRLTEGAVVGDLAERLARALESRGARVQFASAPPPLTDRDDYRAYNRASIRDRANECRTAFGGAASHLCISLHADAEQHQPMDRDYDGAKVYLPGGFLPGELESVEDRRAFVAHLLHPGVSALGEALGRGILESVNRELGIPAEGYVGTFHVGRTYPLGGGVFTRNLMATRLAPPEIPTLLLEAFYYDNPRHFETLSGPEASTFLESYAQAAARGLERAVRDLDR